MCEVPFRYEEISLPDFTKSHWPLFTKNELEEKFDGQPHPIFLQPKACIKRGDQVWFQKSAIGRNTLGKSCKLLIEATPGIHHNGRLFANKTPRRMAITRMEEGLVPAEKAMKITGHRDYKSYKQYNENPQVLDDRSCQRLISGIDTKNKGKTLLYADLYQEESNRLQQVCNFSKLCSIIDCIF